MIKIGRDFQGWSIEAMTLAEIFERLGFARTEDGGFIIKGDDPLLSAYPRLFEDDGMYYGVREQYVISADSKIYDTQINEKEIKVFTLYRDYTQQWKEENKEERQLFKELDKVPIPDITQKEHVRELSELLRETCLDYIRRNGLTDISEVDMNINGINDNREDWEVAIKGTVHSQPDSAKPLLVKSYLIGSCCEDPEYNWYRKNHETI